MTPARQPTWSLTREAFDRLLDRLALDRDAAAREYETIRRRLIEFFDWRGSSRPDAHADETLDRVARRLDAGEAVENVRAYALGVARRVILEWEKQRPRESAALLVIQSEVAAGPAANTERRVACLERCLKELPSETRTLILGYYQAEGTSHFKARKRLAQQLGITYVTLKTRAHRARQRLEERLRACLDALDPGDQ